MNSTEVNTTVPFNAEDQISNVPPSVATQVTGEVLGLCFIVGILACLFYVLVRYSGCCKRDIHNCSNTTSGSSSFSEKEEPLKKVDEDVVGLGATRVSFSGPPLHNLSASCPVFLMEGIEMKEYNNGKLVSNDEEKEVEKGTEGANVDCKEGYNEIEMKENEKPVLSEEKKEEEVFCKTEGHKAIYIEMVPFKNGKPISKEEEKKEDEQEEGAEGQNKSEVEGAEGQDKNEVQGAEGQNKSEVEGAEEQDKNELQGAEEQNKSEEEGAEEQDKNEVQGAEGQNKSEVEGAEGQDKNEVQGAEGQNKSEVEGAEEQDKNELQGAEEKIKSEVEGAEKQDKNEVQGAEGQNKSEVEGAEEQHTNELQGAEGQDKNEVQVEKKDEDNEKKENKGHDGLDGTEIEEIDMEPEEGSLETPCQTEEDEEERAFREVVEYLTGRNFNSNAPPPCFRPPVLPEAEELREVAVGVTRDGHVTVSMGELTETSSSEEEYGNHQAENQEEDEEFQAVIVPRTDYQRFFLQALEISSSEVSDAMDEDATDADREDNDEDKEEVKKGENGNKKEEEKEDENRNKKENDENGTKGNDCGKEKEDGKTEGGMAEGKEGEKQEKNEEHDEDEQTYNFIFMSYEEEKEKDGDQKEEGRGGCRYSPMVAETLEDASGVRDGSSESVYFSYHDEEDEAELVKWTRRQPATPPHSWSPAPRLHQLRAAMKCSQDLRTYRLAREAYVRAVSALGLTMPGRIPHPDLRLREDRIQDSYSPLEASVAAATAGVVMVESRDPTCLTVIP